MDATSRRAKSLFSPGEHHPFYPEVGDLVAFSYRPKDVRHGYVSRVFRSGAMTVHATKVRETDRGRNHHVLPCHLKEVLDQRYLCQPQFF